ncbi:Rib/alpha-like domain-containing protein, partial [Peptoniphilus harei]|uniref:Rib/alpha-like domain-containing protein n=1 Tax=Peptoniphilus harei TaxID=54005 RepID=UPI002900D3C4
MNRKIFSLVTSLAILTSSLSPTWAAGKDFTYNNLNQNLPIKAPVDETKDVEKKIDLPLVTETLPDESARNKYVKIIFIPETSKVGRNQNYGKLRDEEGNEVTLSEVFYNGNFVKGKEYYALKTARWIDVFYYKENDKEVMSVRKADNNESDLEKKNSHKFSGWKFSNKPLQYSVNTLAINLKDHSINNPVIIRSKFHSRPFFYYIGNRPKFDPDGYPITNGSEYLDITFQVDSNASNKNCMLKLSNSQKKYANEDVYSSENISLFLRMKPKTYIFKNYKPETISSEDVSFWYWDIYNYFIPTGKEVAEDLDIGLAKNIISHKKIFVARYIDKYLGAQEEFDFINNPIPKGCYKLKLEVEDGFLIKDLPFKIYGVRGGISLSEVKDIKNEFKLEDENGKIYQGKVAWYDGYKKIDNPSDFKINSDIVLTARPVKDYESEKFTPQVKEIEVNKDEDVTLEKLKKGITNLPKNLDKIEIKTYPDTSEVGEGKATLKLIFTDTSSKEVEIPVRVIEKFSGGVITPIPTINDEDIIKEEVSYNGQINLLDNIKNLPDGAKVEDISDTINTKISGTYTGKVKVIFKDGSSRIVVIPVKVSEALADSYTPQVKKIEVNKDELLTR